MFKKFLKDERGQDLVEYALLAAFIAIVAIIAVKLVGTSVQAIFNKIATELGAA